MKYHLYGEIYEHEGYFFIIRKHQGIWVVEGMEYYPETGRIKPDAFRGFSTKKEALAWLEV